MDLFLGRRTRTHGDMDVLIRRNDQLEVQAYLAEKGLLLYKTQQPGLKPWPAGEYLDRPVDDIWCRWSPDTPWVLQLMLLDTEGDRWVLKRDPRIQGPLDEIGERTAAGVPYLRAEIQLLYKAKPETLAKDQSDFDSALPHMSGETQAWLLRRLEKRFPMGHAWLTALKERGTTAGLRLRKHTVTLRGARITLRPMTEEDWDILARWNSDPEVLWFSEGDDVQARPVENVQEIYRDVSQTAFCFIIETEGRPIGECWLQQMNMDRVRTRYPDSDCRRIDLIIGDKPLWGRGYGTEAIQLLTRFAFEAEGADMVFGLVSGHNLRSRRAFAKAGYTEDRRVELPPGGKARWSHDLVFKQQDYANNEVADRGIEIS